MGINPSLFSSGIKIVAATLTVSIF